MTCADGNTFGYPGGLVTCLFMNYIDLFFLIIFFSLYSEVHWNAIVLRLLFLKSLEYFYNYFFLKHWQYPYLPIKRVYRFTGHYNIFDSQIFASRGPNDANVFQSFQGDRRLYFAYDVLKHQYVFNHTSFETAPSLYEVGRNSRWEQFT